MAFRPPLTKIAITADPDADVFSVQNDDVAVGVIQALQEDGRAGDAIVTGLDATPGLRGSSVERRVRFV